MILIGTTVSCFYFSFGLNFLPKDINSKIVLAIIGIVLFIYHSIRNRGMRSSKELLGATGFAFIFSLICFIATDFNQTNDYSYATYFVSFFVWLGAAYTVCTAIRAFHGQITFKILTGYLAGVCSVQCIFAIIISRVQACKMWVDTYIDQGQEFLNEIGRLYGIGASLDPAGVRFSIVLLMIAFLLCKDKTIWSDKWKMATLWISFCIISVIGNMIARTTTIGMVMGLGYLLMTTGIFRLIIRASHLRLYSVLGWVSIFVIGFSVFLYQTDLSFYQDIRFGFEGFFNWVETGHWTTHSTTTLNSVMWIWPTDFKTWMIGSGLFGNWTFSTDIGYCRFILYCGIIGFSAFSLFFVYNACIFAGKYPGYRDLFIALLSLSFIIWGKVSTDLFLIYALFYCIKDQEWRKSELIKRAVS
jgi:hypothetical protein